MPYAVSRYRGVALQPVRQPPTANGQRKRSALMRTLLKNGRILDPSQDLDLVGHLVIEDDQIEAFGPDIDITDVDEEYDCTDLWIAPGLVDPHVHLREPGQEHKETIVSGT